ncbi:MAG: FtsW/RodA/SpoVE family cell cycle protein, partial [Pseudomonadota bacterium]
WLGLIVFAVAMAGMVATVLVGAEVKGATRWIRIFGFSVQPSEFMKPALCILMASLFASRREGYRMPGDALATMLYLLVALFLVWQKDIGQTFLVTVIWAVQAFLVGLPLIAALVLVMVGLIALVVGYFTLDHVQSRINRFLDPQSGDTYQIERALDAFRSGGLTGVGPGEGSIKAKIPDGHADFILAVGAEEYGAVLCVLILGLFALMMVFATIRTIRMNHLFAMLASAGLIVQVALQSLINAASTIHLIPTKGMTLPMISYGGSSLIAIGITLGALLAITRRKTGG